MYDMDTVIEGHKYRVLGMSLIWSHNFKWCTLITNVLCSHVVSYINSHRNAILSDHD